MKFQSFAIAAAVLAGVSASSFGVIIRTTAGGTESTPGAIGVNSVTNVYGDGEVREEAVKYNQAANLTRGDLSELATRRAYSTVDVNGNDTGGNNSVVFTRFSLAGITAADVNAASGVTLRFRVNTTSFTAARSNSLPADPANGIQYGIQTHVLLPGASSAAQHWAESALRYDNAPGLTYDGNISSADDLDYNADSALIGTTPFPLNGTANVLVGTPVDVSNAAMKQAVLDAVTAGNDSITFLTRIYDPFVSGYNYIFASNDTTALLTQAASPLTGASNADGRFSPALFIGVVPEPTSLATLALGAIVAGRRRKA